MTKTFQRNHSLDFVKIIATICIICHHYQIYNRVQFSSGINFNNGIFYFGYLVELFWVISGYLATSYIRRIKNGMTFSSFFIPKWKRFLVPQLLSCGVFSVLLLCYESIFKEQFFDRTFSVWGFLTAALGFSSGWGFDNSKINGTIWYISVLLFLFVIFYVLCWLAKRLDVNEVWLFAFVILLGCYVTHEKLSFMCLNASTARGYVAFFWGAILGTQFRNRPIRTSTCVKAFLVMLAFPIAYFLWHGTYMKNGISYLLVFVFYTSILIVCSIRVAVPAPCSGLLKIVSLVGELSFEAYVWHFPIILAFIVLNGALELNLDFATRGLMVLTVVCSYLIAIVMYFLVDKRPRKKALSPNN